MTARSLDEGLAATPSSAMAAELAVVPLPYRDHEEHVDEHVGWVTMVLRDTSPPEAVAAAAARIAERVAMTRALGNELPLLAAEERLALSATEMHVVWLLLAHELDVEARAAVRERSTEQVSDPSLDILRRVVYGPRAASRTWRELGPGGKLRRYGVIERTDGTQDVPEHRQTFRLAPRMLALAHGEAGMDPQLATIARLETSDVPLERLVVNPDVIGELRRAIVAARGLVLLHGREGSGRRSLLRAIAGRPTLVIDARAISRAREVAQRQLTLLARECLLLGAVPLLHHLDALASSGEIPNRLDLVEDELPGLVLATSTKPVAQRWRQPASVIELAPLTGSERASVWRCALPQASRADAELLATMYPFTPAVIHAVGAVATQHCGDAPMTPRHIEAGIRAALDDRLCGLASRVTVTQRWEDLILPEEPTTALVELLARIRERRRVYEDWGFADKLGRGHGIAALFSGPPGTGKTMAAGLVARSLHVELYRVDLAKIVSKWVGETEKNLAALFDAAESGHAILLFDEADALFGKRTEVKSSNDRYANQEVNYLLQRMETFDGICILTTNHEAALDEAFRRRLALHVRFPVPEADERQRIWRAMLPEAAPLGANVDFAALAETFAMSGGYIRNAVLRAAFLAADEDGPISASHLAIAAQLEYESMGKIAPRSVTPSSAITTSRSDRSDRLG